MVVFVGLVATGGGACSVAGWLVVTGGVVVCAGGGAGAGGGGGGFAAEPFATATVESPKTPATATATIKRFI